MNTRQDDPGFAKLIRDTVNLPLKSRSIYDFQRGNCVSRRKKRDEERREEHIERQRENLLADATRPSKSRSRRQTSNRRVRSGSSPERPREEAKPSEPDRNRVNTLRMSVSSLMREADGVQQRISDIDDRIGDLPNRVAKIRRGNYLLMGNIEEAQGSLADRWRERGPALRDEAWGRLDSIRGDLQSLSGIVAALTSDAAPGLSDAESRLRGVKGDVSSVSSLVQGEVDEFEGSFRGLDSELTQAENTVELLAEPSFDWKRGEHPIISVRAHHLNDDIHGVLTLTNQRFLFEEEKEVVLKKTLFIATEKKTVRETIIDAPVGAVESLEKGRVGLFKGEGLYVKFAPQTGLKEARFDTRGDEGEELIRLFEYIDSGEAERELEKLRGDEEEEGEAMLVVCPVCSAPYTEEVFRGQTSVECRYCGAVIRLGG